MIINSSNIDNHSRTRDGQSWTALFFAVMAQNTSCVTKLLERGANAAATDSEGATPVHLAAALGNLSICRKLTQLGTPNLLCRDNDGNSAVDLAQEIELKNFLQREQSKEETQHKAQVRVHRSLIKK